MAELIATWSPDDEHIGTLNIEVRSHGFAGQSYAWFDRTQLGKTFIAALKAYPLDPRNPPLLEGNELVPASTKSLRITVSPHESRGILMVRVDLTSWGVCGPNDDEEHTVTACFRTEYGLLARFAGDLKALLDGAIDTAVLRST